MTPTQDPSDDPARTAYLVLGMHRSGTSAVTQLLALAGAQLPANVMPGDEHNAKGYFEPWKIAVFNDRLLRAAGSSWADPFAFPYSPPADAADWLDQAQTLFAEEYAGLQRPLLKDPRVTVLMPFWREIFDREQVALRCVIPVRGPLAVAGSLARRDGFPAERSVLIWTAYMLAAEAYSRGLPRAFVGYDALLHDWRREVSAIEAAHGAALPGLDAEAAAQVDQFLTADLRHNVGEGDLSGLGWAGELAAKVYGWFNAAAAGETPDAAALESAAAELARRQAEFGVLVSPLARDVDAARAELAEAQARAGLLDEARADIARLDDERSRLRGRVAALERLMQEADTALDELLAQG